MKECNEGVRKMSRTEELINIEKTLEFKSKVIIKMKITACISRCEENFMLPVRNLLHFHCLQSVPIISHSRWLLKKGEVQLMAGPKSTKTMRSRKLYQPIYLFLFNNLLLVTKRNSR